MESQDEEQHIYLARKYDIDRSEEEKEYSVGQEQQSEHLAGVVIFPVVEEIIYSSDRDIPYEGAEESYEEQDQRQERIDGGTGLLAERAREHPSHERKDDEKQCCYHSSDEDSDKHFSYQLPSA